MSAVPRASDMRTACGGHNDGERVIVVVVILRV